MVDLKPFKNLGYSPFAGSIEKLVTKPYDIIDEKLQKSYYDRDPNNFIRLVLTRESEPANKYLKAAKQLQNWQDDKVIVEDEVEALYIYDQLYKGEKALVNATGIVGLVGLEPFENRKILAHEHIYEREATDRYNLLDATKTCTESIIGMYSDEQLIVRGIIDAYMSKQPLRDFIFDDGVRHRLWKITDEKDIQTIQKVLSDSKIIIADGHHRYTTALKYYKQSNDERFRYMMMLLWSMQGDLIIYPTHRMIKAKKEIIDEELKKFDITEISDIKTMIAQLEAQDGVAFGMFDGTSKLLTLRDEKDVKRVWDDSKGKRWNRLDVNLLHKLIIDPILNDTTEAAEKGLIKFVKELQPALDSVRSGEYDVIFLVKPTTIHDIRDVVEEGDRMPQKSTYFYPKPLSGLLMSKL